MRSITNTTGIVAIPLRSGGEYHGRSLNMFVDGVPMLKIVQISSPHQNGDGTVSESDLATVAAKLGPTDASAGFDGDGLATPANVVLATQHLGHACKSATPARAFRDPID